MSGVETNYAYERVALYLGRSVEYICSSTLGNFPDISDIPRFTKYLCRIHDFRRLSDMFLTQRSGILMRIDECPRTAVVLRYR